MVLKDLYLDIDQILATEVDEGFLEGMRNRMVVSRHKYGPIREAYPHRVNALESLELRLRKYRQTGNTEFLIDAANFCMIEFMLPSREGAFFKATDSDQSPGRVTYMDDLPVTSAPNGGLLNKR